MARMLMSRTDRPKGFVVYFDLYEEGIMLRDYMISCISILYMIPYLIKIIAKNIVRVK